MKTRWIITVVATLVTSLLVGYRFDLLPLNAALRASVQQVIKQLDALTPSGLFKPNHKGFKTSPPQTNLSYESAQSEIESVRQQLAADYNQASNKQQKTAVLNKARQHFVKGTTTLLPYWYGTPWDFNGTSTVPQTGQIACGYYVTTVLEDNGLHIQRSTLAQQASENIIKSLTDETHIKRFSKVPLAPFIAAIDSWGEGLYIVGLDTHVGYIWHDGQAIHFIHSTNYPFGGVLSEPAANSTTLANSKYRVLGKISDDDKLLVKWLQQSQINTKT